MVENQNVKELGDGTDRILEREALRERIKAEREKRSANSTREWLL
jgi:hypothetical protein